MHGTAALGTPLCVGGLKLRQNYVAFAAPGEQRPGVPSGVVAADLDSYDRFESSTTSTAGPAE